MVVLSSQIGLKLWVWSRSPRDVAKLEDVSDRNGQNGSSLNKEALQTSGNELGVSKVCFPIIGSGEE